MLLQSLMLILFARFRQTQNLLPVNSNGFLIYKANSALLKMSVIYLKTIVREVHELT
jgi:hypothetical protein